MNKRDMKRDAELAEQCYVNPSEFDYKKYAKLIRADESEECAKLCEEFARKWWSIHGASNKHMETTRKAHDDFCALQAAIRARSKA
jgi:hypothetical protein